MPAASAQCARLRRVRPARPASAIHLLWINLVTDGLPALCLAGDPIDNGVMARRPRPANAHLIDGAFIRAMLFTGALTGGVSLAVILVLQSYPLDVARTCVFTTQVFAELLRAFGARSRTRPIWQISPFTNLRLLFVVVISIALLFLSHHDIYVASFLQTTLIPFEDGLMLWPPGAFHFWCSKQSRC